MKRSPAWCPGGRQSAKAERSPPCTSAAAVSATSSEELLADQVPSTNGGPPTKEYKPSRASIVRGQTSPRRARVGQVMDSAGPGRPDSAHSSQTVGRKYR